MSIVGKITVKKIEDLREPNDERTRAVLVERTPAKALATTADIDEIDLTADSPIRIAVKREFVTERVPLEERAVRTLSQIKVRRKFSKITPPNQLKIDQFFSTTKKVARFLDFGVMGNTPLLKMNAALKKTTQKIFASDAESSGAKRKVGRNLFNVGRTQRGVAKQTQEEDSYSCLGKSKSKLPPQRSQPPRAVKTKAEYCIDLLTDSEDEDHHQPQKDENRRPHVNGGSRSFECMSASSSSSIPLPINKTSRAGSVASLKPQRGRPPANRPPPTVPAYKLVEGTSFAVDAFSYGYIPNVTHYFLTHYHSDHYVGLKASFAMPLYASQLTQRLVHKLSKTQRQYLHELELNVPIVIDGVEIIALDANHCPGAIMLLFRLKTGRCILHTGDFRASYQMESEPALWNHNIDVLYLDTTYLANKSEFPSQDECIDRALRTLRQFRLRHNGKRILYAFGSYLIGKEKVWLALANDLGLRIETDSERRAVICAQENQQMNKLLSASNDNDVMHIIPLQKISYPTLVEYFKQYEQSYDMLVALRPSGWSLNSKAQYRGKINIIPIEYSEHSSYSELERFVKYVKPKSIVDTVNVEALADVGTTAVPREWYQYKSLMPKRAYQQSITNFVRPEKHFYGHASSTAALAAAAAASSSGARSGVKRLNPTPIDFSLKKTFIRQN